MKEYRRVSLIVKAEPYEYGKGMEDGFEPWHEVVTKSWINSDSLIKVKRPDGTAVCPYIMNKRGRVFIEHGDYIIFNKDHERHVCGPEKFRERYEEIDQ